MSVRKGGQVIAEVADLSNYALNANVVHTNAADNNIQGQKTFKSNVICENVFQTKITSLASNTTIPSGTDPARAFTWLANDNTTLANIYYQRIRDSGVSRFLMRVFDPTGGGYKDFEITNGGSGKRYIVLPESPARGDNSKKVATTEMIKRMFSKNIPSHTVLAGGSAGDIGSGDITLSQSFLNFDYLMIWSASDGNDGHALNVYPTWMLDYVLSNVTINARIELMLDGTNSNHVWYIRPYAYGSTNTLLKSYEENCIIKAICGINF